MCRVMRTGCANVDPVTISDFRGVPCHPRQRCPRRATCLTGVGGVDLDELFVDRARAHVIRSRLDSSESADAGGKEHGEPGVFHGSNILLLMKFAPEYVTYVLNEN